MRACLPIILTVALGPILVRESPAQTASSQDALFPFVLPWDDASASVANVSGWLDAPAGKHGPVVARDGHFYTGTKRLRLLGVNLCFGASFPDHGDAEKVAARMARFGINAVRFHHMDNQKAPRGLWSRDGQTLDPDQLDKFDYLFAQLKKRGIYADINLHVSREYPGRPRWEGMPSYYKGVDNFDPLMIDLQKRFARDLLARTNPYTKTSYVNDPAVAIVEINNENALTHEWFTGQLDDMPAEYAEPLARRWNEYLARRYADDLALARSWGAKSEPIGRELLTNGKFDRGLAGWTVERHEGVGADASAEDLGGTPALRVDVPWPGKQSWHVQVNQAGLAIEAGRPYTLTFKARSSSPRSLPLNLSMAHDPWRQLWSTSVKLTDQFQSFSMVVQATQDEPRARVVFSGLADRAGRFELADVSFRPGGAIGLEAGEKPGTVPWFRKRDFAQRTPDAQRDWLRFLADVETDYWTGMAKYLKNELKVIASLVGTQMNWSPPHVQAQLDAIDSHAYWQHPHFPGRPWDMDNWTIQSIPMAGRADGGTLPGLGLQRVAGKPFLCTEYNHSAPNPYDFETAPLILAYASMQDWDGVFLFAYSHRDGRSWDTGFFGSFFDIDQHPTKMATLPASAALFLRGDLAPGGPNKVADVSSEAFTEALRARGPWGVADVFGLSRADALAGPVARRLVEKGSPNVLDGPAKPTGWTWRNEGDRGVVTVDAPRSKLLVTSALPGKFDLGDVSIDAAGNSLNSAVISLTALDGPDFKSRGKVLVTAAGRAENTGMAWKSDAHDSVGRNWGSKPSLVEGIQASIQIPAIRVRAWALDEKGHRREAVPVEQDGKGSRVAIGPQYKTLWYELEIEG